MNNYIYWVVIYLVFSLIYAQTFKKANRNMKDASALTVLLELFTAFFAIFFIPFFKFKLPNNPYVYITIFIVTIIYAFTDRLNIEARYGLNPSTFSMLKQLSSVFLVIFGFIFLKEKLVIKKVIGGIIIILADILLGMNKGKLSFNKYFIMCFISNFLFAIAMLINVNISSNFNIAFYTIITVFIPSIYIFLFNKLSFKKLANEFSLYIFIFSKLNFKKLAKEFALYDKKRFLIAALSWCIMLISSVKAYEYGSVSVVAPLLTLSMITNTIYEYIFDKNKKDLLFKLFISFLIIIGVILIKI